MVDGWEVGAAQVSGAGGQKGGSRETRWEAKKNEHLREEKRKDSQSLL